MATLLAAGGLAACDPPPPRLQLTVTTTAAGADTVTGDIRIRPAGEARVTITAATFTVAAGGSLHVHGVNTSTTIRGQDLLSLDVAGTAAATRSVLARAKVTAGGSLLLVDSAVMGIQAPSVENAGSLIALRSSLLAHDLDGSATEPVLHTAAGASTLLVASVVAQPHVDAEPGIDFPGGNGACTGAAPTFAMGATAERQGTCGQAGGPAPTGVRYLARFDPFTWAQTGSELLLDESSRLIDAIPLGDPACDTSAVDLYGRPRGVDGDGDGVGGCDIGAIEHPAAPVD